MPGAGAITRLNVARKYSKSACNYGSSFGKGQSSIWVDKGCRARFNVCYEKGKYAFAISIPCAEVNKSRIQSSIISEQMCHRVLHSTLLL